MAAPFADIGEDHPLALELSSLRAAVARYQHEAHSVSVKLQRHALEASKALEKSHALERENSRLHEEIQELRANPDLTPHPSTGQVPELTLALRRLSDKLTYTEDTLSSRENELAQVQNELIQARSDAAAALAFADQARAREEEYRSAERELLRRVRAAEEERRLADLVVQEYADLVRNLEGRQSKSPSRVSFGQDPGSPNASLQRYLTEGSTDLERLLEEFDSETEQLAAEISQLRSENQSLRTRLEAEHAAAEADRTCFLEISRELQQYKADDNTAAKMVSRYMKFSQSTTDQLQEAMESLRQRHTAAQRTLELRVEHLQKAISSEQRQSEKLRQALDELSEDISREAFGRRREISLRLAFLGREEGLAETLRRWVRRAKEGLSRSLSIDGPAREQHLAENFENCLHEAESLLESLNGTSVDQDDSSSPVARFLVAQSLVSTLTRELQQETDRRLEMQRRLTHFELAAEALINDHSPSPPIPLLTGSKNPAPEPSPTHHTKQTILRQPAASPSTHHAEAPHQFADHDTPLIQDIPSSPPQDDATDNAQAMNSASPNNSIQNDPTAPSSGDRLTEPETPSPQSNSVQQMPIEMRTDTPTSDDPSHTSPLAEAVAQGHTSPSPPVPTIMSTAPIVQPTPLAPAHVPEVLLSTPRGTGDILNLSSSDFSVSPDMSPLLPPATEMSSTESVPRDEFEGVKRAANPQPSMQDTSESTAKVTAAVTFPISQPLHHPLLSQLITTKSRYDALQKSFRNCHIALRELKRSLADLPENDGALDTAIDRLNDYSEDARVELEIRVADEERIMTGYQTLLSVPAAMTEVDEEEVIREIRGFIDGTDEAVARNVARFTHKLDDLQHDVASVKRHLHELSNPGEQLVPPTPTKMSQGWSSWTAGILGSTSRPTSPAPTFGSVMTSPRVTRQGSVSSLRSNGRTRLNSLSPDEQDNPFAALGLRIPMPNHIAPLPSPARAGAGLFGFNPRAPRARVLSSPMYALGLGARGSSFGLDTSPIDSPRIRFTPLGQNKLGIDTNNIDADIE